MESPKSAPALARRIRETFLPRYFFPRPMDDFPPFAKSEKTLSAAP